ncbi:MAG: FHA domain-containing protein [Planctomycetaceae bacterium]
MWIDGVGCWRTWFSERLSIGGPAPIGSSRSPADLALLADLSRLHAEVERVGDAYRIKAFAATSVNGTPVDVETYLRHDSLVTLGRDVRFRFRQPSPLSATATWVSESGHRPTDRIDGIVLMDQTCLIGAGPENHIRIPQAETTAVLFRREGSLWLRISGEWKLDGETVSGAQQLENGSVVTFGDCQFRVEMR